MKKTLILIQAIAIAITFSALTACNTVEGAGKDVKAAGSKLEDSADKNNNYKARSNQ